MRLIIDIWKSRCDKDIIRVVWVYIEHCSSITLEFLSSDKINILLRNLFFFLEFFGLFLLIFLLILDSLLLGFFNSDFWGFFFEYDFVIVFLELLNYFAELYKLEL